MMAFRTKKIQARETWFMWISLLYLNVGGPLLISICSMEKEIGVIVSIGSDL